MDIKTMRPKKVVNNANFYELTELSWISENVD